MTTLNALKKEIVKAGRIAFEHGLVAGASGNISVRQGKKITITKSGSFIGFLKLLTLSVFLRRGKFRPARQWKPGCIVTA